MESEIITYAIAIIIAIFIIVIMIRSAKENTAGENQYDEMMLRNRLNGYKFAFVTAMALMFISMLLFDQLNLEKHIDLPLVMFIIIMASADVFVCYCINKNAYFGIRENTKSAIFFITIITVINFIRIIGDLKNKKLIIDGKLTYSTGSDFVFAFGFLVILLSIIINKIKEKEVQDEES